MANLSPSMKNLALLGKRITTLRQEKGFSQQQLADKCDMTLENIDQIEKGGYYILVNDAYKISEALGVTPKNLMDF